MNRTDDLNANTVIPFQLHLRATTNNSSQAWKRTQQSFALAILIVLLPLIGLMWIAVRSTSRGNFLFSQERKGKHGKSFVIHKVRTMRPGSEKETSLGVRRSDPSVTFVGRILRLTKLDELPQLWNIAKGDMLFVGPRPIPASLDEALSQNIPGFQLRYSVEPGLTSIGQICIRENALGDQLVSDWKIRFEGELHYLRHRGLSYDLLMISLTTLYVLTSVLPIKKKAKATDGKVESERPNSMRHVPTTLVNQTAVANLDYSGTVDQIVDWGTRHESRYVGVCNVHSTTTALWDSRLKSALQNADMNTADGVPLVWLQKLMGHRDASRVYGPTLMLKCLETLNQKSMKIAFYGGHPDRLKTLSDSIAKNYPNIRIVEAISPPFRPLTTKENKAYVDRLRVARPHVVWVGIGCPKQEIWMHENSAKVPAVMVGVGAAFDFHAGAVRQAPSYLQKLGLEWAFRLCCEPKRLFKRYLTTNPVFLWKAFLQISEKTVLGKSFTRVPTSAGNANYHRTRSA